MQFNTPEPFKQDEASATTAASKTATFNEEEEDKNANSEISKNSEVKSTLWQTLNERTSTLNPINHQSQTQNPNSATDRMDMDMDYENLNYILQKNVFRPNLVPSIPDPNSVSQNYYLKF